LLIRTEAASHQAAERPVLLLVQRWAAGPSQVDSPVAESSPGRQRVLVQQPERREAPSQPVGQEQPEHQAAPMHPGHPGHPGRPGRPAQALQQQEPQQAAPGCLA
jgi:hypothetical protein